MQEFSRRLYKRGGSYEVTIPKSILWNLDLKKKHNVVFQLLEGKWSISFQEIDKGEADPNKIFRKLYKRGDSYETTLPHPVLFGLNPDKEYLVVFTFDKNWYVSFREVM